jgi:tRNA (cmo5U34)-methyltransferase
MADFFDERVAGYDEHMASSVSDFEAFYTSIAKLIPCTDEALRILDIGCGTGLELAPIFDRVPQAQVTAIDLSEKMLDCLRVKHAERLEQLTLVQRSYLDVDFGDRIYDFVVAVMTLHHLLPERKRRLYEKIRRALEPEGIYIEGDYVVSPEREQQLLAEYRERTALAGVSEEGMYHIDIPFSIETQRNLLSEAGFARVESIWKSGEAVILVAGG